MMERRIRRPSAGFDSDGTVRGESRLSEPLSRRDLADPAKLLGEFGRAAAAAPDSASLPGPTSTPSVISFQREGMACRFELQAPAGLNRSLALRAFEEVDAAEAMLSVWQPTSDFTRINQAAGADAVAIDAEVGRLLADAIRWHAETDGAFDLSAGPLVWLWSQARRDERWPTDAEISAARDLLGIGDLELTQAPPSGGVRADGDRADEPDASWSVRLARAGMELHPGAVGKGWALDRMGAFLRSEGFGPALLSAGHSSILALGLPPWGEPWRVRLDHPVPGWPPVLELSLINRALSTSANTWQETRMDGRRVGHILDPRTGRPAEGMFQATALAPSAALAEAISTAFFVNGADWSAEYCDRHPDIGAILILDDRGRPAEPIAFGRIQDGDVG
jgi:thiamine biosynthesis lipoprotein